MKKFKFINPIKFQIIIFPVKGKNAKIDFQSSIMVKKGQKMDGCLLPIEAIFFIFIRIFKSLLLSVLKHSDDKEIKSMSTTLLNVIEIREKKIKSFNKIKKMFIS